MGERPGSTQPGSVWDSGCSLGSPTNPRSVSPGWGSGLIELGGSGSWRSPRLRPAGSPSRHSRGPAALGRRLALLVGLAATWGGGAGAGRRTVFPLWDPGRPGSGRVRLSGNWTGSRSPVRRAGAQALRAQAGERAARRPCRPPAAGGALSRLERRSLARRRAAVVRGVRWRRAWCRTLPRGKSAAPSRRRRTLSRAAVGPNTPAYTRRWGPRPAAHLALNYAGTFGASVSPPHTEGAGARICVSHTGRGPTVLSYFRVMVGRMGGSSGGVRSKVPGVCFVRRWGAGGPCLTLGLCHPISPGFRLN